MPSRFLNIALDSAFPLRFSSLLHLYPSTFGGDIFASLYLFLFFLFSLCLVLLTFISLYLYLSIRGYQAPTLLYSFSFTYFVLRPVSFFLVNIIRHSLPPLSLSLSLCFVVLCLCLRSHGSVTELAIPQIVTTRYHTIDFILAFGKS